MVDIAVMFGANRLTAKTQLKKALEFEMKLSNVTMSMEDRRNYSLLYNPISVCDLQDMFPSIRWLEYLNSALNIPNVQIQETDIVIVSVPSYISELEKLINSTSKRLRQSNM
uniref:Peptidase M13 N-terminal domain-containing protein n=2 Tax=Photinus pyralis TaxID=7054 RepID=A0A1Y1LUT0_PHOPY